MSRFRTVVVTAVISTVSLGVFAGTAGASPSPSTPAVEPSSLVYTVKNGEYLTSIARTLKVRLADLLAVNKIDATHVIHPGDTLIVPAGGTLPAPGAPAAVAPATAPAAPAAPAGVAAPAATSSTYVVVAGDYLMGIAVKNGVTLKALLTANNMTAASVIVPGAKLSIPAATLPLPNKVTQTAPSAGITRAAAVTAGATQGPTPTAQQASITTLVAFLKAQLGKPYLFNSAGPDSYDCSGLVAAGYEQIGIKLPHQSMLQSLKGTAVDWKTQDLLPGDLIFQYSTAKPTIISHVGIVIDSTTWIQAARPGENVKLGPIPSDAKIVAVRRIVSP